VSLFKCAGKLWAARNSNYTNVIFAADFLMDLGVFAYLSIRDKSRDKAALQNLGIQNVVIDKTGRHPDDAKARLKLMHHYNYEKINFLVAAALVGGLFVFTKIFASSLLIYRGVNSAWRLRTLKKLEKGEWTVQTKPPALEERKTAPVSAKLATVPTP
jgi:hypothetical protein